MHSRWIWLAVVWLGGLLPRVEAQPERFELGQRLRLFERAWDQQPDALARQRAITPLLSATQMFFSLQLGKAGQALDNARFALRSAEQPPFAVLWAESLYLRPRTRLLDASAKTLRVEVRPFYPLTGEAPAGAKLRARVGQANPVEVALGQLPQTIEVPLEGNTIDTGADLPLHYEVLLEGKAVAGNTMTISLVPNLAKRLNALREAVQQLPTPATTIEQATLRTHVTWLTQLEEESTFETNLPAAWLLREAEACVQPAAPVFTAKKPGDFWMTLPTGAAPSIVRLYVPDKLDPMTPTPLVVALHGAGGSENLFFEGYGDGITKKMCVERGWLMVAPRAALFGGANVPAIIDELAKRYPIDRERVLVVGHSMGAAQSIALAQRFPKTFRAVAALGGGGTIRDKAAVKGRPFFVGVGTQDFALRGAKALVQALREAGANPVEFKEYPSIEHMLIVREAIPEVFRFFEKCIAPK